MTDISRSVLGQLGQLSLSLRAQLDQAEAHVPNINALFARLAEVDRLNETIILGLVIYEGHYNILTGPHEMGQVVQAALMVPQGFGVICWDSAEYLIFRKNPPRTVAELLLRFVAFETCPPAIKTLLLPQVHPLLAQFLGRLRTAD